MHQQQAIGGHGDADEAKSPGTTQAHRGQDAYASTAGVSSAVHVGNEEHDEHGRDHAPAKEDEERKTKHDQRGKTVLATFCVVM
jgi:hypothetical protein